MDKIVKDVKGMDCPVPLITLKSALADAKEGQEIEIDFTCPEALSTLPDYCDDNDIELVSMEQQEDKSWKIVVIK